VTAFTFGYSNGAHCANPAVTTIISYTNTFISPTLGAQLAQAQMAQGADVVFGVGGETGNGAILTATQSGSLGIGVDFDQYYTLFMSGTVPGSDYLVSGSFISGTVTYDLAMDAVGLAPFHETAKSIPPGVRTQLELVKQAIISGSIDPLDPNEPCPVIVIHQLYLPLSIR
jgi:basic membrane protein A